MSSWLAKYREIPGFKYGFIVAISLAWVKMVNVGSGEKKKEEMQGANCEYSMENTAKNKLKLKKKK
jgi:hypothetical protein